MPVGMRRVELDELALDDSLAGVPLEFVLHIIRSLVSLLFLAKPFLPSF